MHQINTNLPKAISFFKYHFDVFLSYSCPHLDSHLDFAIHEWQLPLTALSDRVLQESKTTNTDPQSTVEAMTNSSASDPMAKDAGDMASPYGTRSRNRSGNPRPNYAEDKDIEMDNYDFYQGKKDGSPRRAGNRPPPPPPPAKDAVNGDATRGNAVPRKTSADEPKTTQSQNGTKDQISSTPTTTSTNVQTSSAVQPSRKRKATAQSAASTGQVTSVNTSVKKNGNSGVPPAGISWPDTNMLTFENCNSRPDNRRMVADDGTVLEPNGDSPKIHTHMWENSTAGRQANQRCRSCVPRL